MLHYVRLSLSLGTEMTIITTVSCILAQLLLQCAQAKRLQIRSNVVGEIQRSDVSRVAAHVACREGDQGQDGRVQPTRKQGEASREGRFPPSSALE